MRTQRKEMRQTNPIFSKFRIHPARPPETPNIFYPLSTCSFFLPCSANLECSCTSILNDLTNSYNAYYQSWCQWSWANSKKSMAAILSRGVILTLILFCFWSIATGLFDNSLTCGRVEYVRQALNTPLLKKGVGSVGYVSWLIVLIVLGSPRAAKTNKNRLHTSFADKKIQVKKVSMETWM